MAGGCGDEIKVRTGFIEGIVWARRVRSDPSGGQVEVRRYGDALL